MAARRSSFASESVDRRSHSSNLECKVTAFVPGVDLVDGRCDIEQASYYMQIFADGDVYDIRRTAGAFFDIDQRLGKRFPKMNLPMLPLYQLPGASAFNKHGLFKSRTKQRVLLSVDEMLAAQSKLGDWIADLISFEAVLSSEELHNFLTEQASEVSARASADYDSKIKQAEARFGKGAKAESVEELLLEALPISRVKVQPGSSHVIRVTVDRPGDHIVWGFTTLPGKTSPAKDIAFSVTFEGSPVRAYERCVNAPYQLKKGYWTVPGTGEVRLTWHNDYSKWYAKHVAIKVVLAPDGQLKAAHRRIKKLADARNERLEHKDALVRAMHVDGDPRAEGATGAVRRATHHADGIEGIEGSVEAASLRKENQNLQMAIADLTQENTNQRNQLEKLGAQLHENRGNEDVEKVLVKRTQQVHALEAELLEEQRGHYQAREQCAKLRKLVQEKLEDVNELQEHARLLEAQLDKTRDDRRTLRVVAKQFKEDSKRKAKEIQELQRQLHASREEATGLRTRATAAVEADAVVTPDSVSGGGGTPATEPASSRPAEDEDLWVSRLQTFYRRYFPDKAEAAACRATVRKFPYREGVLFTVLYHKYAVQEIEQIYHTLFAPSSPAPPHANGDSSKELAPPSSSPSPSAPGTTTTSPQPPLPPPPPPSRSADPGGGKASPRTLGSLEAHMAEWYTKHSSADLFSNFSGKITQFGPVGILSGDLLGGPGKQSGEDSHSQSAPPDAHTVPSPEPGEVDPSVQSTGSGGGAATSGGEGGTAVPVPPRNLEHEAGKAGQEEGGAKEEREDTAMKGEHRGRSTVGGRARKRATVMM